MDTLQVIPPPEWTARSTYRDIDDLLITTPTSQKVTGEEGIYELQNIKRESLTFAEFSLMAESEELVITE